MKDSDIKKMIDKMPTDDAIDVLDVLSERRLEKSFRRCKSAEIKTY